MALNTTQTDAQADGSCLHTELAACGGRAAEIDTNVQREAVVGGTPGTVAKTINVSASAVNTADWAVRWAPAAGVSWDAGTWTVRMNVTTANMNIDLTEIHICRHNSACVTQESIGSATGLTIDCGTTGVKSQTVTGSAVTPVAGDVVIVVFVFTNAAMTIQSIGVTPDQNIDSPFTAPTLTKLYLRNTQANAIGATYYDMLTTAGASADTGVVASTTAGTEIQLTKTSGGALVNFVTPPLSAGFTLTTADLSIWAKEDNVLTNVGGRARLFRRQSGGTETELAGGPFDDGVEFTTTDAEYTWTANFTDTAFIAGDRLLLKLYITNIGVMVVGDATFTFNAADAATGDAFILVTPALTFSAEDVLMAQACL